MTQPGIPQQWYWHGSVWQGSVRFNLSEEATPSSPLDVHTLWERYRVVSMVGIVSVAGKTTIHTWFDRQAVAEVQAFEGWGQVSYLSLPATCQST